jgi:hypothetical protein
MIRARLETENETFNCIGTVLAKHGCWSFLKGGFVLNYPSNSSTIFFQNTDGKDVDNIDLASPSLQPFTKQQWRINQQYIINTVSVQIKSMELICIYRCGCIYVVCI